MLLYDGNEATTLRAGDQVTLLMRGTEYPHLRFVRDGQTLLIGKQSDYIGALVPTYFEARMDEAKNRSRFTQLCSHLAMCCGLLAGPTTYDAEATTYVATLLKPE